MAAISQYFSDMYPSYSNLITDVANFSPGPCSHHINKVIQGHASDILIFRCGIQVSTEVGMTTEYLMQLSAQQHFSTGNKSLLCIHCSLNWHSITVHLMCTIQIKEQQFSSLVISHTLIKKFSWWDREIVAAFSARLINWQKSQFNSVWYLHTPSHTQKFYFITIWFGNVILSETR